MTKWEYYIEPTLILAPPPPAMGDPDNRPSATLNHVGKFGWEAFAAWPTSLDGSTFCVLFKRPAE
jgi:hypothetical protein